MDLEQVYMIGLQLLQRFLNLLQHTLLAPLIYFGSQKDFIATAAHDFADMRFTAITW
jgi:hypothetical protein